MHKLYDIIDDQLAVVYDSRITLVQAKDHAVRFAENYAEECPAESPAEERENRAWAKRIASATTEEEIRNALAIFEYSLIGVDEQ